MLSMDETAGKTNGIDVWNTASYPRTELVLLSKEQSAAGDRVTDEKGKPVPSQRLTNGEPAFMAGEVPPYAARRYTDSSCGRSETRRRMKPQDLRRDSASR